MVGSPTGREVRFEDHQMIVSKTDTRGVITYANRHFMDISGFTEPELVGKPHSLIRHPDMPGAVFGLLWDTIQQGKEIFAYVKNICKNGDHYWVFAHVTPTFATDGRIIGYHSNRRNPDRSAIAAIEPIYASLRELELAEASRRAAVAKSRAQLKDILRTEGVTYGQFIHAL